MKSSCLNEDRNYVKPMRPSGDFVKRTRSERAKTPASEEMKPAISQKDDTDYRVTSESKGSNEERTKNWES